MDTWAGLLALSQAHIEACRAQLQAAEATQEAAEAAQHACVQQLQEEAQHAQAYPVWGDCWARFCAVTLTQLATLQQQCQAAAQATQAARDALHDAFAHHKGTQLAMDMLHAKEATQRAQQALIAQDAMLAQREVLRQADDQTHEGTQ